MKVGILAASIVVWLLSAVTPGAADSDLQDCLREADALDLESCPTLQGSEAKRGCQGAAPMIAGLEQYRGRHGAYPHALSDLVPEYMSDDALRPENRPQEQLRFDYHRQGQRYEFSFIFEGCAINFCEYVP